MPVLKGEKAIIYITNKKGETTEFITTSSQVRWNDEYKYDKEPYIQYPNPIVGSFEIPIKITYFNYNLFARVVLNELSMLPRNAYHKRKIRKYLIKKMIQRMKGIIE